MVAHEHVQAGGVAAAHLEPVDGRERDLDRRERLDRGRRRAGAGEVGDPRAVRRRSRRTAHTASLARTSAALPASSSSAGAPWTSSSSSIAVELLAEPAGPVLDRNAGGAVAERG